MNNLNRTVIAITIVACSCFQLSSQDNGLRTEDKIRIKEAMKIVSAYGDKIWNGWSKTGFPTIIVADNYEYLISYPYTPSGFQPAGFDSFLSSEILKRDRKFDVRFEASFPVFDSITTIVIGIPENTAAANSSRWVITYLHEHFHQLQDGYPDYQQSIEGLDLKGNDSSGMWMLNFKFPYEDEKVSAQFRNLLQTSMLTVLSTSDKYFHDNYKLYLEERDKFKSLLSEKDYRYFSFQIWQEGLARYTEYKLIELMRDNYKCSEEFQKLKDYIPFDTLFNRMHDKLLQEAMFFRLEQVKRVAFYTLGALEGLILDRVNPNWRDRYFTDKFYIEKYY
jgi:hypothetical protein